MGEDEDLTGFRRVVKMQNFTLLLFSAAEESVTIKTNKKHSHSKLNTPKLPYGGIKRPYMTTSISIDGPSILIDVGPFFFTVNSVN